MLGTRLGIEDKKSKTDCFPALTEPEISQERQMIPQIGNDMGSKLLWDIRKCFSEKMPCEWMSER